MAAAASGSSPVASGRKPLSPRTKLFQTQQFDQLKSLDIMLLNISSEAARKRLRADFAARGDSLERDEFVEAVLRILPESLQFRSPFGMGDGVENAKLNSGIELTAAQRRAAASSLVDRVDTDGDGCIDWSEMSQFILYQSAIVSQSDFTVGRILAYRPIHETGSLATAKKKVEVNPKLQGLMTISEAEHRLNTVLRKQQAATSQVIQRDSLMAALRRDEGDGPPRTKAEVVKQAAAMKAEERRVALLKLKGKQAEHPDQQAKMVSGPAGVFNKSGIYGGLSLVEYVPEIDAVAVVEPKATGVRLLRPDDLSELGRLKGKGRAIEAVTSFYTGEGKMTHPYLVAASANSTISIFDLGKGVHRFTAVNAWPTPASQQCLLYSQRYGVLLSGSSAKGAVHTWSARTGTLLSSMTGHTDMCTGLAELAEEDRVVSASHDKTVRVWDLATCRVESVLRGHRRGLCGVALYEERGLVVSGSYDHTAKVWSPRVSAAVLTLEGHSAPLINVASVSGTSEVITASMDGDVCVWDMRRGASPVHRFTVSEGPSVEADSADGTTDGASHMTTFALCLRRKQNKPKSIPPPSGSGEPYARGRPFVRKMPIRTPIGTEAVAPTPADVGLSAMGRPSIVAEVVVPAKNIIALSSTPASPISGSDDRSRIGSAVSHRASSTGEAAAAGEGAQEAAIRRTSSGLIKGATPGASATLDHEKLARRPKQAEVASRQVQQLVFGIKTLHSFTQQESPELLQCSHLEPVVAVGYSPLNHTILSAAGSSVRVWSALVGVLTRVFDNIAGEDETISAMVVDPRGVTFAIGTENGLVQLHNATSGHRLRKLSSHAGYVSGLAWFSLGVGLAVVSGGWDGRLFLHSVKETPGLQPDRHTEIGTPSPATGRITCVAVVTSSTARDEGTLSFMLAGDVSGGVRVFNTSTGQCVKVLPHAGMVTSIVTVPEMDLIITTDVTATVLIWSIRTAGSSFGLMAAFRHVPVEFMDRTGIGRSAASTLKSNLKKSIAKKQFKLGVKTDNMSKEDQAALMTPSMKAHAEKEVARTKLLQRHEQRQSLVRADVERPSLAERMLRGEPGTEQEFKAQVESVKAGRTRTSFRNSVMLSGRGATIMGGVAQTGMTATRRSTWAGDSLSAASELDSDLAKMGVTAVDSPLPSTKHMRAQKRSSAPMTALTTTLGPAPSGASAAASGAGVPLGKDLLQYTDRGHVLHMYFSLEDYMLYTADDDGFVTKWSLKALLKAMEVQARRSAKKIGMAASAVKRRLSVDMTDDMLDLAQKPAVASSSSSSSPSKPRVKGKIALLRAASAKGAFDSVRQPVLAPGSAAPVVNAAQLVGYDSRALTHQQGVTGMVMMRNPHMPETLITCGFDKCVRGSVAVGLDVVGRLCQSLTETGVNPHWAMDVDVESWLSESDGRVLQALRETDARVKHSMAVLSGAEPERRARSRTVAMVNQAAWRKPPTAAAAVDAAVAATDQQATSADRGWHGGRPAGIEASSEPAASPGPMTMRRRAAAAASDGWFGEDSEEGREEHGQLHSSHTITGTASSASLAGDGPDVLDELDLFTRAAASVPLPQELRFSLTVADEKAPARKSRVRSALARMLADDADGDGGV